MVVTIAYIEWRIVEATIGFVRRKWNDKVMVKSMVVGMVVVVVVEIEWRISRCFGPESVVDPPTGAQVCREQRGDLNARH